MASWFWLNIPACVVIFTATAGIPLRIVFRHPREEQQHSRPPVVTQPKPSAAHRQDRDKVLLTH